MIPLWKEREIRKAIEQNPSLPDFVLATRFRTHRKTIATIRQAPALRPRKVPKPRRTLAKSKSKRCEECGALLNIWPCPLCRPWNYYYDDTALEEDYNGEKETTQDSDSAHC